MNVCVVGNRGFIGRHVVDELAHPGMVLDPASQWYGNEAGFRSQQDVLLNQDPWHRTTGLERGAPIAGAFDGAEAIIDLAPLGTMRNTHEFFDRLHAARVAGVSRYMVVSSGGAVYGPETPYAIDETHPTRPISEYGMWKLTQEKIALEFDRLPVIVVRPGNVYGPGQIPFIGQGLVATAMGCAITGCELTVYGNSIRDYVYVKDAARGIVAALYAGLSGQVYNVGTGVGRHNLDVVRDVRCVVALAPAWLRAKFESARDSDVPINTLSSEKLYRLIGWLPQVSWKDGLERTWKWLRECWARGERDAS